MSLSKIAGSTFPFQLMETKPDALDHLEIEFVWGNYRIRVLRCHLAFFPPKKAVPFHQHSEYEFHFIPRGKGKVIFGGHSYELKEDFFYLTGPGVEHYQEANEHEAMEELCLHIDVFKLFDSDQIPDFVHSSKQEILEAETCILQLDRLPLRPTVDQYNAMQWFLTAYRAWYEDQFGMYSTISQAIIQILLRSVRAYSMEIDPLKVVHRDMQLHRYLLATQFIMDNYAKPLTLGEVADKLSISERQLQRILLDQSGSSFSRILEDTRLTHVCEDLRHNDTPIREIALQHGFMNSNYLYYVFRKRFGITPKQFRDKRGG